MIVGKHIGEAYCGACRKPMACVCWQIRMLREALDIKIQENLVKEAEYASRFASWSGAVPPVHRRNVDWTEI